jgi:uncharacterized protein (DUF488 family)
MSEVIYTIGYAGYTLDRFISLLMEYNINALIDVRSVPYSSYYKEFNKENMYIALKRNNISYMNFKEEFGAKGFDINSDKFNQGITRIKNGLKRGYRIILMCAEKRVTDCHRLEISKELEKAGHMVVHFEF